MSKSKNNVEIPKFLEIGLSYGYLPEDVIYTFPRLRKKDADLLERERLLGQGKKLSAAEKLATLVENIVDFPNFEPRNYAGETEAEWRSRVRLFFGVDDMLEFAEDALLARSAGAYPTPSFRRTANNSLEVNSRDKEETNRVLQLRQVHETGEKSGVGVSEMRTDNIVEQPQKVD